LSDQHGKQWITSTPGESMLQAAEASDKTIRWHRCCGSSEMLWSWLRADGTRYVPANVPAAWRRVADLSWRQAQTQYGSLDHAALPIRQDAEWRRLHAQLVEVSQLWRPTVEDAAIEMLDSRAMYAGPVAAFALRAATEAAIKDGLLTVGIDDGSYAPTLQAKSLRAFLLAEVGTAIGSVRGGSSYRRCDHCKEWFPLGLRADARYCTPTCRGAAHAARHA
jgi:hypothetical protein